MSIQKPVVGFVGMTHLGLNSAVAGAERGFQMVCFDLDPVLVARLNESFFKTADWMRNIAT